MADIKYKEGAARTVVIDDNVALANNTRAAADYNNDTLLDLFCDAFLKQQFDTTAPAAGDKTGELYILPGDNAATEVFPEGGDAGLGTNDDPQKIFLVGVFETINPSISVDETLGLPGVRLYMAGNRFVFKNVSGQQMDLTWQLDIHP
ncbi:MAG: hypothetical protein ACE5GT_10975, partial [Rhodospirillales bacterium]